MGKKKTIRHMGMSMTEAEHRRWHEQHDGKELTDAEHAKLMRHLGISKEEDEQWHKGPAAAENAAAGEVSDGDSINPFAIGGGFLEYCVRQNWLIRQGRGRAMKYYITDAGRTALAKYGITKY